MNNQITIEEFTEKMIKGLKEHYKENYLVRSNEVVKNNGMHRYGITVSEEGETVSPTIYIDGMYYDYLEGKPLSDLLDKYIETREAHRLEYNMDLSIFSDYEKAKGKLGIKLINKAMNQELLKEAPYMDYSDLALVFIVILEGEELGGGCIIIKNKQMNAWGVDVNTLYEDAVTQMAYRYPAYLKTMLELLEEIYIEENGNVNTDEIRNSLMEPARENMSEIAKKNIQMYVLTNKIKWFGASVIAYPHMLDHIADEMGGAYYVIPSSIHELIIVPKSAGEVRGDCLCNLIKEVNSTQLQKEEILSDHPYEYIPDEKKLMPLVASA